MATKVPGWVKLVGVACAGVVLLGAGLAAGSFFLLRSTVRQFDAADRSFEAVVERHGEIAAYRPEPDGTIRAERLETFLAIREKASPRREQLESAMTRLSGGALSKTRGTVGLMRNLAPFHSERNEALMETGIGLGEYYYMYTLAYYSWLGKAPADGPPFKVVGADGYIFENIESEEDSVVREFREEQARLSLNQLLLPVLRGQLTDLSPDRRYLQSWEETLASEIAALEADPRRIPWEDGLPDIVERSFRPYRDRLNDSYSTMCNAIEIGLARRSS